MEKNKIKKAIQKLHKTSDPDIALTELLNSEDISVEEKVQVLRAFIYLLLSTQEKQLTATTASFKGFVKTFKSVFVKKEDLAEL